MTREIWAGLPRAGRVGAIVALVAVLPLAPFLAYAGTAIMNIAAQHAQNVVGEGPSVMVAVLTFGAYAGLVFSVVFIVGAFLGIMIQRIVNGASRRGA